MDSDKPTRVGTHAVQFRLEDGRLTRLPQHPVLAEHPWSNGAQLEVRLDVFEASGRLYVGRVEVTTVPTDYTEPWPMPAPRVEPLPVGVELWRLIKLGTLSQEAIEAIRKDYWTAAATLDDNAQRRLDNASPEDGRRTGRHSALTPEVLQLVSNAVTTGGRGSIRNVQAALGAAGYPGAGPDGGVTTDQAKKAIARARRDGYLPPTQRRD
nr:hypothetical protein [Propionicimonas sp.]